MARGLRQSVTITMPQNDAFSRRGWQAAIRYSMQEIAKHWHTKLLPLHFKDSAVSRYGYKPRTGDEGSQKFTDPMPIVTKDGTVIGYRPLEGGIQTVKTNWRGSTSKIGKGMRMPKGTLYARYKSPMGWRTTHGAFGYTRRKIRKYGHRRPLDFSGKLKDAMLSSSVQIKATPALVNIRMRGPNWLRGKMKFRGRTGTGPDMEAELLRIIPEERAQLAVVGHAHLSKFLRWLNQGKRV